MSADQGGAGRREVAYRLFAAEYDDAEIEYSDSDEERAPNYVVTPTGARANRLFVVGVLTEVETVSDDVLRGRVVDPTGAFVIYAGQYQPDAQTFLERAEPPTFVAVTGKARTFRPDDSDRVFTSIRPESINEVDAETRDRWTVQAAEQTLDRVSTFAAALERPERGDDLEDALIAAGVDRGLASGVPLAIEGYGTTTAYLAAVREMALAAAEVVAGERDEVPPLDLAPDEGGEASLPAADLDVPVQEGEPASATPEPTSDATPTAESDVDATTGETAGSGTETGTASGSTGTEPPSEGETGETSPVETTTATGGEQRAEEPATGDDLGDFDDYGRDGADGDAGAEVGTGEMYEFDEGEREAVEEEYGTEFSTGTEVDPPDETDVETPEPAAGAAETESDLAESEPAPEPEPESEPEPDVEGATETEADEADAGTESESEPEPAAEAEVEPDAGDESEHKPTEDADAGESAEADGAEDVDLEEAVVEAMRELDSGDGAETEAVIEAVTSEYGADHDAVGEAVEDALMSGKCYEPDDGRLKAI